MKQRVGQNRMQGNRANRRKKEQEVNYFRELIKVVKHFFPDFMKWLRELKDPRDERYIYYDAYHITDKDSVKYITKSGVHCRI